MDIKGACIYVIVQGLLYTNVTIYFMYIICFGDAVIIYQSINFFSSKT